MSAHDRRITVENNTSYRAPGRPNRPPAPRPGDVLASERTARADVYEISVVPASAQLVVRRYPEAITTVRELSRQRGVDGWYTADQTHYAPVARYRAPLDD
jgi:hypothetical protein